MVNLKQFLKQCYLILKDKGIDDYKHDTNVIFAHVLGVGCGELIFIDNISNKQYNSIKKMISKRALNIPLQHITKSVEFLETKIYTNKNVLIPRNETELLADIIVKRINNMSFNPSVLDLCTGSGAIGISIAYNTMAKVVLSDISKKALLVAKKNAKYNNVNLKIVRSDLFKNVKEKFDIIISNPPYIPSKDIDSLMTEVRVHEPILALDGGEEGLDFYKKIISDAKNYLNNEGLLCFEIGINQHNDIVKLLKQNSFEEIEKIKDYNNVIRIIIAKQKK